MVSSELRKALCHGTFMSRGITQKRYVLSRSSDGEGFLNLLCNGVAFLQQLLVSGRFFLAYTNGFAILFGCIVGPATKAISISYFDLTRGTTGKKSSFMFNIHVFPC